MSPRIGLVVLGLMLAVLLAWSFRLPEPSPAVQDPADLAFGLMCRSKPDMVRVANLVREHPELARRSLSRKTWGDKRILGPGTTLLHAAAMEGDRALVRLLLDRGAEVNALDESDSSAVYFAVDAHDPELLRTLLSAGADPTLGKGQGSALNHCALAAPVDLLALLLEEPHRPSPVALGRSLRLVVRQAWRMGDEQSLSVARLLLEAGADPDIQETKALDTALHFAVETHRPKHIELLLSFGADPNASNELGVTPLHGAATADPNSRLVMARLLLEAGADPNRKTKRGRTAVDLARQFGADDVCRLLQSVNQRLRRVQAQ